jgi:hypothetical protein
MLTFRHAGPDDAGVLAEFNRQLIEDEGHRNRMSISERVTRMRNAMTVEIVRSTRSPSPAAP